MKSLIIASLCLVLSACQICPEKPAIVEYRYVTKSAPAELYNIPAYPQLDITDSTQQSDVAAWILDLESRSRELENQILRLRDFFEAPISEQPK